MDVICPLHYVSAMLHFFRQSNKAKTAAHFLKKLSKIDFKKWKVKLIKQSIENPQKYFLRFIQFILSIHRKSTTTVDNIMQMVFLSSALYWYFLSKSMLSEIHYQLILFNFLKNAPRFLLYYSVRKNVTRLTHNAINR